MQSLRDKIRRIDNFPKKGIVFRDITTLLKDAEAFKETVDFFYNAFKKQKIDYVAAIESRGYLIGAPLAYKLGCGLVIIRKPGKLPAEVERAEYELEYGTDALEIHKDAIETGKRVLVFDDLLATGGTIKAACELVSRLGGELAGAAFMIELKSLNGRKNLPENLSVITLLEY